jgi:hypothetical protein
MDPSPIHASERKMGKIRTASKLGHRPDKQIVEENSTRNKIDHLFAQIEQSIFDCPNE